jgi:hypothetical protein
MEEILIDAGEFVLEDEIEEFDRLGVAAGYSAACLNASRWALSISAIVSWHVPHFLFTPLQA